MRTCRQLFFLLVLAFLCAVPASASVASVYVAQSAAGGNTGVDCADAFAVTFFNTAGNWGAGAAQIGSDTVVHLCGTITTPLTIQGSGTSGHVITILWESGARVSVADGGIININGANSFLLFNGGTPCGPNTSCDTTENSNMTGYAAGQTGIIEATANGSALTNQNSSTQAFYGCSSCHDIEIKNLIIRNLYQHTLTADATANIDSGTFIWQCHTAGCASGVISIHDSAVHDTGNAISIQGTSSTTVKIFNIDFSRNNWALEYSGNGTRTLFFNNNVCRDAKNWDTTGNPFHHNCIHSYMNTSSDSLGTYIYNNYSPKAGDWGTCCTTSNFLFIETAPPANLFVFNNVVFQNCSTNTEPAITTRTQNAGAGGTYYNNSFFGCATTGSNVTATEYYGTGQVVENNVSEGYGQYVVTGASPNTTFTTLDYNTYGAIGTSGNSPWQFGASGTASFATWKTDSSGDSHGQNVVSSNTSSTGVPNSGSPLIGACTNLTSIATGNLAPLAQDMAGNARPSSGNWTCGALNQAATILQRFLLIF